jgi:putative ABC transport system permease protein
MSFRDLLRFTLNTLRRSRMRSAMLLLAMAIGVAAVIMLTSLGEGARRYVAGEFQALGTRMIIVIPGRSETGGMQPGLLAGETPRDLTLSDARALTRIGDVELVAPLVVGSGVVSSGHLERSLPVLGSTAEMLPIYRFEVGRGEFLPAGDIDRDAAVAVIGANVARELLPGREPVGSTLRIGDRRFRVVGVLSSEGRSLGFDMQEIVIVPVTAAQALFNTSSLFRVLVQTRSRESMPRVRARIIDTLKAQHQGEEDVTVITQDALLSTFDRIFTALTMTLAGIASISLAVAGVLVMNVMLVSVSQRTSEIGLLKALGATRRQITVMFLAEAVILSLLGATAGLIVGTAADAVLGQIYPALPLGPPTWAVMLGVLTAIVSGVVFGLLPARRAARLDPVIALAGRR